MGRPKATWLLLAEDADLQEGQEGPKRASAEPASEAAVNLDQAKSGMAGLGSDSGDGADEELPTEEARVPATGNYLCLTVPLRLWTFSAAERHCVCDAF